MKTLPLSIIIITYNNYSELISSLESIESISNKTEVVVVNGGECHKTSTFLRSQNFKGRHLTEPDTGISNAFNKGINLASREYITFLNSGDLLIDNKYFEKAISKLELNDNLKGVSSNIRIISNRSLYIRKPYNPLPNCPFNHPGFIFRSKDLKSLKFKEEYKVAMDFDLFIRLTDLDFSKVALCENVAIEMKGGGVSQLRTDLGALEKIKSLEAQNLLRGKLRYQLYLQLFKGKIKQLVT